MLVEASTSEATLDAKQVTETVSAAPSSGYLIPADPIQQPATACIRFPRLLQAARSFHPLIERRRHMPRGQPSGRGTCTYARPDDGLMIGEQARGSADTIWAGIPQDKGER